MKEEWKAIKDYEGLYEISNCGRVKALAKKWDNLRGGVFEKEEMIRKTTTRRYEEVRLSKNRIGKSYLVHQLVYDHFGKGKRDGMKLQIDHIDNNKLNNRIDNLQLVTNRENTSKGLMLKKTSSKYTGVHWHKGNKKWNSNIRINGKQVFLGCFKNEYDAHLAYQKALKEL